MTDLPQLPSADPAPVDTTAELLALARAGDEAARNLLVQRCLPALRRWAHGRLPAYARDLHDTADVVQDTVIAALGRLQNIEARREGALQAYLRQALANRITDIIRYRRRRPDATDVPEHLCAQDASPLEQAIGDENIRRYEAALARLSDDDRQAVIARLELHYSYDALAVALEKPTANAARAAVLRAMKRLADAMRVLGAM